MRDSLASALVRVVTLIGPSTVLLGGSGMLALRGLDLEPGDIDLMAVASDRARISDAVTALVETVDEGGGHRGVDSAWRLHLSVGGEQVEIMGGLAIVRNGVRWELPMRSDRSIAVLGTEVHLAAVAPWVALYSLINRGRAELAAPLARSEDLSEIPEALGIEWPHEA